MCAVVLVQSCKKENSGPQRFYATLQQYNGDKVYINEPYSYWEVGDKVAMTHADRIGTVGYNGTSYYIDVPENLTYTTQWDVRELAAVYPYDLPHLNSYQPGGATRIELEPTQKYEEYQPSSTVHYQKLKAPMAAYIRADHVSTFDNNSPTFEFKNLCALLRVNIETDCPISVTRIEIENTGANADFLWGDFQIAFPGGTSSLTQPILQKIAGRVNKYITLKQILNINHYGTDNVHVNGGDPISPSDDHPFYIYLAPVNYHNVHITVYIMDGNTEKCYTLLGNTSGTFQANHIYPVSISYSGNGNDYPDDPDGWHVINTVNNIGEFTVGVDDHNQPRKVTFSRANVQGLNDNNANDYFFALHQYHYIGNPAHNPFGIYDHFDQGHESIIASHFYTDFSEHWRFLTSDELSYIMNSRSGYRFCWAKVASVPGMIIFPDGYQESYLPSGFPTTDYINTQRIDYEGPSSPNPLPNTRSIDVYTWFANFESRGCIFLPCITMEIGQSTTIHLYSNYWLDGDDQAQFHIGSSFSTSSIDGDNDSRATTALVRMVRDLSN